MSTRHYLSIVDYRNDGVEHSDAVMSGEAPEAIAAAIQRISVREIAAADRETEYSVEVTYTESPPRLVFANHTVNTRTEYTIGES